MYIFLVEEMHMFSFPIGVILDSYRLPVRDALGEAAKLGVQGIQVYATRGELSSENMTVAKRSEFLDMVRSHGLTISALCGDLGQGFGDREKNPLLIDKSKRILELARELDTDIVTTHIGVIPEDRNHPRYQVMLEACDKLSRFAENIGAKLAVETGPERAVTLKEFLDDLSSKGIAVNMDPANFVMVTGDDPVQAVYTLSNYIVHTHAKDGRKLADRDPEIIYRIIEDEVQSGRSFVELPLGEGDVSFPRYLKALKDIGYKGFLTVEREVGEYPAEDIEKAVLYLRDLIRQGD
jgi:L-ribulose-5-phosphate 3-epimerase